MVLPSWLSRQDAGTTSLGRPGARAIGAGVGIDLRVDPDGTTTDEPYRSDMVGRDRLAILVTSLAFVIGVSACAVGDAPPPAGIRPDGFPTGVFEKTYDDPELGPLRLSWVFATNGDWAEVPEATAGQTIETGPLRGHYTVDGDLLSIRVEVPFSFTHEHHWELAGDRLITGYEHSDLAGDADFFAMLDRQPWVRVP
jgi:hypothetical protein